MKPTLSRSLLPLALALALGCATVGRPPAPQPPPSPGVLQAMGYEDVVKVGQGWMEARGYRAELTEATQLRPNYWRLRFGLAPKGSGRLLTLEFDGERREWVKTPEPQGVAALPTP